jgi:hypothetical protein
MEWKIKTEAMVSEFYVGMPYVLLLRLKIGWNNASTSKTPANFLTNAGFGQWVNGFQGARFSRRHTEGFTPRHRILITESRLTSNFGWSHHASTFKIFKTRPQEEDLQ